MKPLLKLEIQTICMVHIIAIILSITFLMIFYIQVNKNHAIKAFLIMQLSMIFWMLFKIFKTVAPTEISRWWFIVGYYFCTCVLEVSFLEFAYAYYYGKPLANKVRCIIYMFPILQFIAVLTNPYHHLFYATYTFGGDSFGVLFYIHTALEYSFISLGFFYCYKVFKIKLENEWYKYLISSAIIIPLILNFLFITKAIHKAMLFLGIPVVFDITPIVFTWSTLVFVYATFNYDFLSLSPILRHEIVHKLNTPICVLDSKQNVIYVNEKLDAYFNKNTVEIIKKALSIYNIKTLNKQKLEIKIKELYFVLYMRDVNSMGRTQTIITFQDITPYKNIEYDIIQNQKNLNYSNNELKTTIKALKETSKIGARNYVARELHDVIGHSLVVAIKLLEVTKLYFHKDLRQSMDALSNAATSLQMGLDSMNALSLKGNVNNIYTSEQFRKDLLKLLDQLKGSGLKTKLHFKGAYVQFDDIVYDIVKKICTELITNSLKHSDATEIFVSINIQKETLNALIIDNGKGCNTIIKGNGLNGIEQRLKIIGGTVEYHTSLGEGFMSKISIHK